MSQNKPNRRYLANVVTTQTQYGPLVKALMNNLSATKEDGSPNTYYKGNLVWYDVNGKAYKVKQMQVQNTQDGRQNLIIDLDSSYHVEEVQS